MDNLQIFKIIGTCITVDQLISVEKVISTNHDITPTQKEWYFGAVMLRKLQLEGFIQEESDKATEQPEINSVAMPGEQAAEPCQLPNKFIPPSCGIA